MLGTFNETTLPTQSEVTTQQPTVELFSIEEDKYSALREVELELKMNNESKQSNTDGTDDFGEFLSAEVPSTSMEEADLWGDWKKPEPPKETSTEFPSSKVENDDSNRPPDVGSALNFDLLSLNEDDNSKPKPLHDYSTEVNNGHCSVLEDPFGCITEPIPDLKEESKINVYSDLLVLSNLKSEENCIFPSTSHTTSELNVKDLSEDDFGVFFTSDFNAPVQETTREDSLPSLELRMLSSEGGEQENIRKKCLMACLNLLQQGMEILNGVKSTSVLEEVFATQEAINYLNSEYFSF